MTYDVTGASQLKKIARSFAAEGVYRSGLFRIFRRTSQPNWRIITYHRVIDPEASSSPIQAGMYVRPKNFRRHMTLLSQNAHVVSLEELISAIRQNTSLPENTVVITFDDGWLDNYINAFPILRELALPATFFLATSYIGSNNLFWTDKVSEAVVALRRSVEHHGSVTSRFESECSNFPNLCAILCTALGAEHFDEATLESLLNSLKLIALEPRQKIVTLLYRLAQEFGAVKPERAFLSWEEVQEMAGAGFTFASHTHRHQDLRELTAAQIRDEIDNSFLELKQHNLPTPPILCCPGGRDSETTRSVSQEKHLEALIADYACNDFHSQPLILQRIGMHDDVSSSDALFASRLWANKFFA